MKSDLVEISDVRGAAAGALVRGRLLELGQRFPLAWDGLLSIFDQAVVSGTSLVTAIIINRTISPDQVGLYYLILSIIIIATGIQEHLVAAPFTIYSKRRSGRDLTEYAGSTFLHHAALTTVGLLVLLATIGLLSLAGGGLIVPGLWALAGAGPLLLLREGIRRFALANLHIVSAIGVDLVVAAAQCIGLALLARYGGLSIFTIYGVMGGACALAALGWFVFDPPNVRLSRQRFFTDWKHNWSFGKWALRSYLIGNTTPYFMPWILGLAAGPAAVGMFGACATLVGLSNVLQGGVDRVLTPRAAQAFVLGGTQELRRVLVLAASFLALLLGTFSLVLVVAGGSLAVFLYGELFRDSGAILVCLGLSALMTAMGMVTGNGLWALEQPRANFVADVCGLFVTVAAAAFLVSPYGALGAALASLAGTSTAAVVRTATLVRAFESARETLVLHSEEQLQLNSHSLSA